MTDDHTLASGVQSSAASLSIVVATFNDADNLRLTLQSITEQQMDNPADIEVLVIDGGSRDSTPTVVADFADLVTTFVSEQDRGVYDAMNKGIRLASGRLVQFLNAGDTFADPQAASAITSAANRAPDALWLVGKAWHLGGGVREPVLIANVPHNWLLHAYGLQSHCHQACAFDRNALLHAGGHDLDIDLVADFDVILRFGMLAPPVIVDHVLVNYEGTGMSYQRRAEIPGLLHQVRVKRGQLGRSAAFLDASITHVLASYNKAKITAGSARRRLKFAGGKAN